MRHAVLNGFCGARSVALEPRVDRISPALEGSAAVPPTGPETPILWPAHPLRGQDGGRTLQTYAPWPRLPVVTSPLPDPSGCTVVHLTPCGAKQMKKNTTGTNCQGLFSTSSIFLSPPSEGGVDRKVRLVRRSFSEGGSAAKRGGVAVGGGGRSTLDLSIAIAKVYK